MAESVMKRHTPLTDRRCYEYGLTLKAIEHVCGAAPGPTGSTYYVKENVDRFVGPAEEIDSCRPLEYNPDQINPGKLLLSLYERTGDDRYRKEHMQRQKLVAILRDAAAALGAVRDGETGLWYQVLAQGSRAGSYSSTILVGGS